MRQKIVGVAMLAAGLGICYFLVSVVLAKRLLTNLNECYDELGVGARINTPLSDPSIDKLYDEWQACVELKNTAFENTFGRSKLQEIVLAMREDRKKNGPFNRRDDQ